METLITGNVMYIVLASVYGKYIVVTCHILTSVSQRLHRPLFARYIYILPIPISIDSRNESMVLIYSFLLNFQNVRPEIPKCCPSSLANVMKRCWDANPDKRPEMDEVVAMLEAIDTSKGGGMIPFDQQHGCLCFGRRRGP